MLTLRQRQLDLLADSLWSKKACDFLRQHSPAKAMTYNAAQLNEQVGRLLLLARSYNLSSERSLIRFTYLEFHFGPSFLTASPHFLHLKENRGDELETALNIFFETA